MKPPTRHRIIPTRFESLRKTEPNQMLCNGWSRQEKQHFIRGLNQQQKINSELNLMELRKQVPKRSLLEIQNVIKSLKTSVLRRVHHQVQKQRREEQRTKVPIDTWAELAQRMAWVHEDTISSAFSQMLVIAATEPCSLLNSNPPRSTDSPAPTGKNICSVPTRNLAKSKPVTGQHSTPPSAKIPLGLSGKMSLKPSCEDVILDSSDQSSSFILSIAEAGKESSAQSTPKSQPTSGKNQSPSLPQPQKKTLRTTTSRASRSNQLTQQAETGQPGQPTLDVVDFEKIYQFLSKNNSKNCNLPLTAMESAVLLDLLMSLPEELPLLNCMELQYHLLQVHMHLMTPAALFPPNEDNVPPVSKPVSTNLTTEQHRKDVSSQPQNLEAEHQKSAELPLVAGDLASQSSAIKQKGKTDWAEAGICPLNPFMVPLGLLKRQ